MNDVHWIAWFGTLPLGGKAYVLTILALPLVLDLRRERLVGFSAELRQLEGRVITATLFNLSCTSVFCVYLFLTFVSRYDSTFIWEALQVLKLTLIFSRFCSSVCSMFIGTWYVWWYNFNVLGDLGDLWWQNLGVLTCDEPSLRHRCTLTGTCLCPLQRTVTSRGTPDLCHFNY